MADTATVRTSTWSRREVLRLLGGACCGVGCTRPHPAPNQDSQSPLALGRESRDLLQWDLGRAPWGRAAATAIVPRVPSGTNVPLLIALHGRSESLKAPDVGALGWPRDYELLRAFERLGSPPVTPHDLQDLAPPSYVTELNVRVRAHPFQGLVVVCPHLPDLDPRNPDHASEYYQFLETVLIPKARSECPVLDGPRSCGIDGVSHGGSFALQIGLRYSASFGGVGAIQPAIHETDVPTLTGLAAEARKRNPALALSLVTSDGDYFREAVGALSVAWNSAGLSHRYICAPGPHDYPFNRGPGAYELLTWHDSVLAR